MRNLSITAIDKIRRNPPSKVTTFNHAPALVLRASGGGKLYWRYKYRWEGKQTDISLGEYDPISLDHVSIGLAEERWAKLKNQLKAGIKPSAYWETEKKETKNPETSKFLTFGEVAQKWLGVYTPTLKKEKYRKQITYRVDSYLIPPLKDRDITTIEGRDITDIVRAIPVVDPATGKKEKFEIAKRIKMAAGQIFEFAYEERFIQHNIRSDIGKIRGAPKEKSRRAIKAEKLPIFFAKLQIVNAKPINKLAMLFLMLTAARTEEVQLAEWRFVRGLNGINPVIRYPAELMKNDKEHEVFLALQTVLILQQARSLYPQNNKYIFPSEDSWTGHMSDACLREIKNEMGFTDIDVHGHRGLFKTEMGQAYELREGKITILFKKDWIELALAHQKKDAVERAYDHAEYLEHRKEMLCYWANYLEGKGARIQIV
jgi:integrase